jgi:hypothetical protein
MLRQAAPFASPNHQTHGNKLHANPLFKLSSCASCRASSNTYIMPQRRAHQHLTRAISVFCSSPDLAIVRGSWKCGHRYVLQKSSSLIFGLLIDSGAADAVCTFHVSMPNPLWKYTFYTHETVENRPTANKASAKAARMLSHEYARALLGSHSSIFPQMLAKLHVRFFHFRISNHYLCIGEAVCTGLSIHSS